MVSIVILLIAITSHGADAKSVVQAEMILEQIKKGEPVNYHDVIIVGDLNLRYAYLKTVPVATNIDDEFISLDYIPTKNFVDAPIIILNSTIQGSVDFSNTIFNRSIAFAASHFEKGATFWNSQFKYADFRGTNFNATDSPTGGTNFWLTGFSDGADFSWSKFNGLAFFWKAQFDKTATFDGTEFRGDVVFDDVVFAQRANFIGATFNGTATYIGTSFKGDANLYGTKFNRDLLLVNTQFTRLEVEWYSIKDNLICDGPMYLALIKNFRDLEQFSVASDVDYTYRLWRQGQTSWFEWSKYTDILAWLSCGYGERPSYPLGWSLILISIFGILYWKCNAIQKSEKAYRLSYASEYKNLQVKKNFDDLLNKLRGISLRAITDGPSSLCLSFFDAFYFSVMIFFVSHPPTDWRPSDKWKWWKFVIAVEDILGWLLLTLFVVTLTHTLIQP